MNLRVFYLTRRGISDGYAVASLPTLEFLNLNTLPTAYNAKSSAQQVLLRGAFYLSFRKSRKGLSGEYLTKYLQAVRRCRRL